MILEISALIASAALLLLVLFLIPSVVQMRRTAKRLEETSETLNANLPPILSQVHGITSNMTTTSSMLKYRAEDLATEVDRIIDLVHQGADLGKTLQQTLRYPLTESVITLTAMLKGISTFIRVWRQDQAEDRNEAW